MKIENCKLKIIGLFFVFCFLFFVAPLRAETLSSDNYKVEIKQIEKPLPTAQPTPLPIVDKPSVVSLSGSFEFFLSHVFIDFGVLSPTNPVIRATNITASRSNSSGFSVFGYENHALSTGEDAIADTTCDNGSCREYTASSWNNVLTYGFGYRCDNQEGNGCMPDFLSEDYFKQFADISNGKKPQIIIKSNGSGSFTTQITYKVNVSNTFKEGQYSNTVTYIAVPAY